MKEPPAGAALYPPEFAKVDFIMGYGQPEGADRALYMVKWRGLGGVDATWETEEAVNNAQTGAGALAKFKASGCPTPSPLWQAYSRAPPSNEKGKRTHIRIYLSKPQQEAEEEGMASEEELPASRRVQPVNRFGVYGDDAEEDARRVSDDNPLKQALLDSMEVLGVGPALVGEKMGISADDLQAWLYDDFLITGRQELKLRQWLMDRLTEGWEDRKDELLRSPANLRETYSPARLILRAEMGLPYTDLPLPSGSRVVGEHVVDTAGAVAQAEGLPAGVINLSCTASEDGSGGHTESYAGVPLQALGELFEGLGGEGQPGMGQFMQQLAKIGAMGEQERKDTYVTASRPIRGRTMEQPPALLVPLMAQHNAVSLPVGKHDYSRAHVTVAASDKAGELQPGVQVPVLPAAALTAPELMPAVNSHSVLVAGMWLPRGLTAATFPFALNAAKTEAGLAATDASVDALLWAQYEALQCGTTDPSLWASGVDPVAYAQGKLALAGPLPSTANLDVAGKLAMRDQAVAEKRRAQAGKPTRVLLGQMEARMPKPTVYGPPGTDPDRDNRPRGGSRGGITRRVVLRDDEGEDGYSSYGEDQAHEDRHGRDSDSDYEASRPKKKSATPVAAPPAPYLLPPPFQEAILHYSNGAAESWVASGARNVLVPVSLLGEMPFEAIHLSNGAGPFAIVLAHPDPSRSPAVAFFLPVLSPGEVAQIQAQANAAAAAQQAQAHA